MVPVKIYKTCKPVAPYIDNSYVTIDNTEGE